MSSRPFADDPDYLRQRADLLRQVIRGITDREAFQQIERFITELEAKAGRLS